MSCGFQGNITVSSAELKGATLRKKVKLSERALLCERRCREPVNGLLMPSEIIELRISRQRKCELSLVEGRDLRKRANLSERAWP
jgi:hypothetical protein